MSKLTAAVLAAMSLSLPVSADPLLELMRTHTKDGPVYAYEMSYEEGDLVAAGKVDPSQPEGQRISIYTPAQDDWPEDFAKGLAEMEAETDGDIWCSDFAETVPADATITNETATSATYAFTPLPEADADNTEKKLMKKIDAEITLDKTDGAVLGVKMRLPKPYKPVFVAKIEVFDMQASCARAPDGRTYLQDFAMAVSGSAMMQSFDERVTRKITALLDPVSLP